MWLTSRASPIFTVNRRHVRLFIEFILAPLAPVLLYYLFVLPKLGVLVIGAPLSYFIEILIGIPLFLRARNLKYLTQNACIVGSFISGATLPTIVTIIFMIGNISTVRTGIFWNSALLFLFPGVVVFGFCGAIAGWIFSILAGVPKRIPAPQKAG